MLKYRGTYLVFVRTAQGSRGAPLTWASVASILGRILQSLFITDSGQEGCLQIYVDDPLLALKGTAPRRKLLAVRYIAVATVLGITLAFPKAKFGMDVIWIGVQITVAPFKVTARIPAEKVADLKEIVLGMLRTNQVPVKLVRSLAGKATNISTLIFAWRPFLSQLWAALSTQQTHAAVNCVWKRQIETTLLWLLAFLVRQHGTIERLFTYESVSGIAVPLEITCDASIYGYGAWLSMRGKPLQWFSVAISADDAVALGHSANSASNSASRPCVS